MKEETRERDRQGKNMSYSKERNISDGKERNMSDSKERKNAGKRAY